MTSWSLLTCRHLPFPPPPILLLCLPQKKSTKIKDFSTLRPSPQRQAPQKPIAARHEKTNHLRIARGCELSLRVRPKGGRFTQLARNPQRVGRFSWHAEPRFRSKSRMNFGMNLQCLVVSPRCSN